ncbi:hypothetical protein AB0A05_27115 [Streptomyces sp. NPDC046374]|uniref:hypothetical protein n=1 Tax=Streptomyces sp. NPDC046374 TaxID=3154917 RepID=UPI0033FC2756
MNQVASTDRFRPAQGELYGKVERAEDWLRALGPPVMVREDPMTSTIHLPDAEGVPGPFAAVPTGVPEREGGILPILALPMSTKVDRAELDVFLKRHRFVQRHETSRAVDSQARWTQEKDGRTVITFLDAEGAARIALPRDERIGLWANLIRGYGGTLSVMVIPEQDDFGLEAIAERIRPGGTAEYWHLSVGYLRDRRP